MSNKHYFLSSAVVFMFLMFFAMYFKMDLIIATCFIATQLNVAAALLSVQIDKIKKDKSDDTCEKDEP